MTDTRFPGAAYQYWDDVPDQCPREGCTGILRRVSDGVTCIACSRTFVVAQALVQAMNLDRWLNTPELDPLGAPVRKRRPVLLTGKIKKVRRYKE